MIIGFAGRLKSGKSELAKICEKNGYQKLYFALPLKQLCAEILDISVKELNKAKNENIPIELTMEDDICLILSEETNIPLDITKDMCNGKYLHTVRDMLQFIGTDYIRQYNKDWHVNKIKAMISDDTNYVIDDVRFPNEKQMIEDLGGDVWFITRTTLDNISNHTSETSITWKQCWNRIIVNDSTLSNLQFKWEIFMDNYEKSLETREKEFNKILNNGLNANDISPLSILDVLMLSKSMFTYAPKEFSDIKKATMNEDKSVFITHNDDTIEVVENPLNIEDLKFYI